MNTKAADSSYALIGRPDQSTGSPIIRALEAKDQIESFIVGVLGRDGNRAFRNIGRRALLIGCCEGAKQPLSFRHRLQRAEYVEDRHEAFSSVTGDPSREPHLFGDGCIAVVNS